MKTRSTDVFTKEERSRVMRAVGRENTSAELAVRAIATGLSVRYRLNRRALPGSPDLSNVSAGWAVFVHGCFWHGHAHCKKTKGGRGGRIPEQNREWWARKIAGNRARYLRKARRLRRLGIRVMTVWECELRDKDKLRARLARFLGVQEGKDRG